MAIIKCPECGHQISDKAPVCPNCGVEIAGKIIRCPNCGEVYFANEEMCPNCHRPTRLNKTSTQVPFTSSSSAGSSPLPPVTDNVPPKDTTENKNHSVPPHRTSTQGPVPPRNPSDSSFSTSGGKKKHKKRNYTPLIIAVLIALVALGIMYHFYSTAQT